MVSGMFVEGIRYSLEASLAAGAECVSVSAHVVCRLSETSFVARSRVLTTHLMVRLAEGPAPASGAVTLFQFSLVRDDDVIWLLQETASAWMSHTELRPEHWDHVTETCTGIGALGAGAQTVGLRIVARNEIQANTCRLLELLGTESVVEGDIGDHLVVRHLWNLHNAPSVLAAGFSCQPYSQLGDRKGGHDSRAWCLPHVLQAALLLNSSAVVLECVQQAAQDDFVRACLEVFCQVTGFHRQEVKLDLSSVWAAHRARWWCVLTPPQLGPCPLSPWPHSDSLRSVGEVLHCTLPMSPAIADLQLTAYEVRMFTERRPMSAYLLRSSGPLPTTLHSAACQVYPCPCGCRATPFSEARLNKGLYAVVTPCHGSGYDPATQFRHLAPAELALLNGLSPKGPWGPDPRLADCLIGQLASPLQSAWVFSHLQGAVHQGWPRDPPPCQPLQVLDKARLTLLQDALEVGLRGSRAIGDGNPPSVVPSPRAVQTEGSAQASSDPVSLPTLTVAAAQHTAPVFVPVETAQPSHSGLPAAAHEPASELPTHTNPPLSVDVSSEESWGPAALPVPTVRPAPYQVSHGGTRMKEVIAETSCRACDLASQVNASNFYSWQLRDRADVYLPPGHVLQPGDVLRFTHVASSEGVSLPLTFLLPKPALVEDFLQPSITCLERATLLHLQHGRLADDQMHYLLRELPSVSPCQLVVLHPLEVLSAFQHQCHDQLEARLAVFRLLPHFGVVGAAPLVGHWVTFAWICNGDTVTAWNSYAPRHTDDGISIVNFLLGRALHRALSQFRFTAPPVRPLNGPHCGRFALADLKSWLLSQPYLGDHEILAQVRREVAGQLPPSVNGLVPMPLCIASGQELLENGLAATLRTKGVPESQAKARAAAAITALGAGKVQQAMQSKAPWRELKAVANQAVPVFQFVLPSELELAVKARSDDGRPIPSKRKQKQPPPFAVQTSRKQHSLLPALDMLRVPTGVFTSEVGELEHIQPGQVGPHAKGIFLLGHEEALPYTQVHKPVSSSALGLLVLGHSAVDGAFLAGSSLRFTAQLISTGEPLLLSAHLYQLGAIEVAKFQPQQTSLVEVTPSTVVKACLFRDEVSAEWSDVVRSPVKALLDAMPQLQTCKQIGCNCQHWHGSSSPGEPQALLEIWGRAFTKSAGKPDAPLAASLFSVFLRIPTGLLRATLLASGVAGVYVEPRDNEQRRTSPDYKVVWLQRATLAEARLIKQTTPAVLGLARLGDRLGLRCSAEDEEELHNAIRPDTPFLPQGAKHVVHSGPWPPGTQKAAITKLLSGLQWRARPVQPLPGSDATGTWWVLHAATPPAQSVVHTQAGELLLVEQKTKSALHPAPPPAMVAARATLQHFKAPPGLDPLAVSDPWAEAVANRHKQLGVAGAASAVDTVQTLKAQLESAVLTKLRHNQPSVDADGLAASVEQTVLSRLQPQLQEATANAQAAVHKVQALEVTVADVAGKVDRQEGALRDMFNEQMSRIEALLGGKRQRQE